MKKIILSSLLGIGCLAMPMIGSTVNAEGTALNIEVEPTSIIVNVPTEMNVIFKADGSNYVSNYHVENKTYLPMYIKSMFLTPNSNWEIAAKDTDMRFVPVDTRIFSFYLNGDNGEQVYFRNWNGKFRADPEKLLMIDENQSKDLTFGVNRPGFTKAIYTKNAFELNIDYAVD